jgi:protocatechuate 3,4-dioxygenase beta subunit
MMRASAVVVVLFAFLSHAPLAMAQSTAAMVSGTVVDEQKGALPGATITIRNLDSGQVRTTATDARGAFQIVGIPPGRYEVTAELTGFARVMHSGR